MKNCWGHRCWELFHLKVEMINEPGIASKVPLTEHLTRYFRYFNTTCRKNVSNLSRNTSFTRRRGVSRACHFYTCYLSKRYRSISIATDFSPNQRPSKTKIQNLTRLDLKGSRANPMKVEFNLSKSTIFYSILFAKFLGKEKHMRYIRIAEGK